MKRKKIKFPEEKNHLRFEFDRFECCQVILKKSKVSNETETFIEEVREKDLLPKEKQIGR